MKTLAARGIDTSGFESDGVLQADLFLSRPAADVRDIALEDLVTVASGRNRSTGTRYVQVAAGKGQRVALEP